MGFLATLLLSLIFGILGVVRPRLAVYSIIVLFIFFDELGPGFTTYRGSFVFNAFFVGFYGLRLVEVLTLSAYIPMLIVVRKAPTPFRAEKILALTFFSWIAILMAVEYGVAGKSSYSDWRLIVTGAMQFHMLVLMFRDREDIEKLLRLFLVLLTAKATYGLCMYAAGFGAMTPRGTLPFFWDSRQVEAFGLGVVILTGYLLNYASMDSRNRLIPYGWAILMWLVLLAAVGGSIRRTIWASTLVGMLGVLMLSRRTNFLHYFAILFVGSAAVGGILLAPGLDDFRSHMGKYVESMNLFDYQERMNNVENSVHINNVESYYKMLTENSDMLMLGLHGPSGVAKLKSLRETYSEDGYKLGLAHNGVLATTLFFGIPGALMYLVFYFVSFIRSWRIYWRAPEDHALKHVALACGVYLLLDFVPSLLFVPPFYNSSKGLFYTFFQVFIVGIVAHQLVARAKSSDVLRQNVRSLPIAVKGRTLSSRGDLTI